MSEAKHLFFSLHTSKSSSNGSRVLTRPRSRAFTVQTTWSFRRVLECARTIVTGAAETEPAKPSNQFFVERLSADCLSRPRDLFTTSKPTRTARRVLTRRSYSSGSSGVTAYKSVKNDTTECAVLRAEPGAHGAPRWCGWSRRPQKPRN